MGLFNIIWRSETISIFYKTIKSSIQKVESEGTLQTQHRSGHPPATSNMAHNMQQWLLASPVKSLHWLSQEIYLCIFSTMLKNSNEGRNSLVPCYSYAGAPTSWHAEKSSLLPVVSKYLLPKTPSSWTWHGGVSWKLGLACWDVISQNTCMWATENPHASHKLLFHP